MSPMPPFRITGLMAAPFAPFSTDGSIAPALVPAYAARLRSDGVRGVFVNGTTGEGQSLTDDERRIIVEAWVPFQEPDFPVVVHVGHTSLRTAQAHAAHALRAGAAAIAAVAPYFIKPDVAAQVEWLAGIAEAAPGLPLFHYHIPSVSGVAMRMADLLEAAAERVPTLAGVKFTHDDLHDFRRAQRLAGRRFDLVFGRDEVLLAALACGARGAVGSTYNYAAPLYLRLMRAFAAGDLEEARGCQDRAQELVEVLIANGGGITAGKAVLAARGLDLGPCRLPSRRSRLSVADVERIGSLLAG